MSEQEFVKKFVYKSTLRTFYGLTDKYIAQIGAPDKIVPNPHYRTGAPANLYLIERVEAWIDSHAEIMQVLGERRRKRNEQRSIKFVTGFPSAIEKARSILAWAGSVKIEIRYNPQNRKHRNIEQDAWLYYLDRYDNPTVGWNGVVAYIRHNLTNYEQVLSEMEKRQRQIENIFRDAPEIDALFEQTYQTIRYRVDSDIALLYPEYSKKMEIEIA